MEERSIFFYLLILVLLIVVLHGLTSGTLFFFKRSGVKRANIFFGLLLIAIGLTLLHNIFTMTGLYENHPSLYFLPIYFTLALPTLLFYYVKLNLYPAYRLRWTDAKHFVLPLGQFLFFLFLFLMPIEYKSTVGRHFYNPFFGAFEQFLYLTTFFSYMYFAYRYVRKKRLAPKDAIEARKILYLEKLIQILFILFCIHAVFVLADFISYEFLNVNLRTVKPYAALGALSFAALVLWLSVYGFQVLVWGRKIFRKR